VCEKEPLVRLDWTVGQRKHAVDEGLTDAEVLRAETKYDIHFPDDLREFLQMVLPRGYPIYPDWRSGEEEWIRGMLRYPLDGILFDVEHNDFWRATGVLSRQFHHHKSGQPVDAVQLLAGHY
jgi:hypothetical protein